MKLHLVVGWHHFSVVVVVAVPLPRLLLDLPLLLRRRRAPVHQESHSGTNSLLSLSFATSEITSIQFCQAVIESIKDFLNRTFNSGDSERGSRDSRTTRERVAAYRTTEQRQPRLGLFSAQAFGRNSRLVAVLKYELESLSTPSTELGPDRQEMAPTSNRGRTA